MINFAILGPIVVGVAELVTIRLSGNATTFGYLQSAYGIGALLGVWVASQLGAVKQLQTPLMLLASALGMGLIALGFVFQVWTAAIIILLMGIGGGIVGLATGLFIGKRFPSAQIIILEKESQLAYHQTGHNSGVIHSGVYYKPGSFKAKFTRAGNQSMVEFCQTHDLPYDVCGKVIVATQEKELPRLENLFKRGLENNLSVTKLSPEEVRKIEPHVNCLGGIKVPTAGIVNYKKVCQKYGELIQLQGGEIRLNTDVTNIIKTNQGYTLETNQSPVNTKFLTHIKSVFIHSFISTSDITQSSFTS
jgi:hypothetical protein